MSKGTSGTGNGRPCTFGKSVTSPIHSHGVSSTLGQTLNDTRSWHLDQRLGLIPDREQEREPLRTVAGAEFRDQTNTEQQPRFGEEQVCLAADAEYAILDPGEQLVCDRTCARVASHLELCVVDDSDSCDLRNRRAGDLLVERFPRPALERENVAGPDDGILFVRVHLVGAK